LNIDESLAAINKLMGEKLKSTLTAPEELAVRAALLDVKYENITEGTQYSPITLSTNVGPALWRKLADVFEVKITKKNLRSQLLRFLQEQTHQSQTHFWGTVPMPPKIIGRENYIPEIFQAFDAKRCTILYGFQGIGKSTLALKAAQTARERGIFEVVFWRSIATGDTLIDALSDICRVFVQNYPDLLIADFNDPTRQLLRILSSLHCLVILDGINFSKGYVGSRSSRFSSPSIGELDEATIFLGQAIEASGPGRLLMTTRQINPEIERFQVLAKSCSIIKIQELSIEEATQLVAAENLNNPESWPRFIELCSGNPLAIKLTSIQVRTYFKGNVEDFLQSQTVVKIEAFREIVANVVSNALSEEQRQILKILTGQERYSFQSLLVEARSVQNVDRYELMEILDNFENLSLVNKDFDDEVLWISIRPDFRAIIQTLLF
jgi:hypothetical protein